MRTTRLVFKANALGMAMRKLVGTLRLGRGNKGLTQEALGEKSELSQQCISGLESGRRIPTILTRFELVALDVGQMRRNGSTPQDSGPNTQAKTMLEWTHKIKISVNLSRSKRKEICLRGNIWQPPASPHS